MFSTMSALIVFCQLVNAEDSSFIDRLVGAKDAPYERHHHTEECSGMSHRYLRFSDQLNDANLKVFCSQFATE